MNLIPQSPLLLMAETIDIVFSTQQQNTSAIATIAFKTILRWPNIVSNSIYENSISQRFCHFLVLCHLSFSLLSFSLWSCAARASTFYDILWHHQNITLFLFLQNETFFIMADDSPFCSPESVVGLFHFQTWALAINPIPNSRWCSGNTTRVSSRGCRYNPRVLYQHGFEFLNLVPILGFAFFLFVGHQVLVCHSGKNLREITRISLSNDICGIRNENFIL